MKKILLFLYSTTYIQQSAIAQTSLYHPFPESNAVWNIKYEYWLCPGGLGPHEEIYSCKITGDTSVGGFTYHKLLKPFVQSLDTCFGGNALTYPGYAGCYRQDTLLKKVFFINPNDSVEQLLYDFNLQVGDTVKSFLATQCSSISNIDSILINGSYRKRWEWIDYALATGYFIEGIGSTWGLLEYACQLIDGPSTTLACFSHNGISLYPDSLSQCGIITGVRNIPDENISVTISPNPFHTTATLKINGKFVPQGGSNLQMKIYDVLGKCVHMQPIDNRQSTINNTFADGIYFYQLTNDKGQMTSGKFVVE